MKSWNNGDSGSTVKKIIDGNFAELEKRANQAESFYIKEFTTEEWDTGKILIDYFHYNKLNPRVELYIKLNKGYEAIIGGYEITSRGVTIQSDIAFDGKVVIK